MIISKNANNYEAQKIRGLKRKYEAIISRGGKCECCGYNKNLAVLEFHHTNPMEKKFQIDIRHFSNSSLTALQNELDKCQLLCANCHRELHNKELELVNVPTIIEGSNKTSFSNQSGSVCPVCGKHFPKMKGKIYCSKECREKDKHYPSKDEVVEQYNLLGSWDKVAKFFGLTRRVIQGIRKNG